MKPSPTSYSHHKHILSPAPVINIDVAMHVGVIRIAEQAKILKISCVEITNNLIIVLHTNYSTI